MKIDELSVEGFRNLNTIHLFPHPGINIIYGENAQGKTNLVEAIWLLTGDRSFRGSKDSELIQLGEERTKVRVVYSAQRRQQTLQYELAPQRKAFHNEIALPSIGKMAGAFLSVVFSPSHLSLVKEGPAERREFLDLTICQLKPQYHSVLLEYQRVLTQRNSLLKDIPQHAELLDTLDLWDQQLARLSALIMKTRYTYLEKIKPYAIEIYDGLARHLETLSIQYQSRIPCDPLADDLQEVTLQEIRKARGEDLQTGTSTMGTHRDDILFSINGLSARNYGSQGQQRSIVLALKLAECNVIYETAGEQPVVLLDDVMSELDAERRDYLLNCLQDQQIFITCCDQALFEGVKQGKKYLMQSGKVSEEEEW